MSFTFRLHKNQGGIKMKKNKIAYIATAATITAATMAFKNHVDECAIKGVTEICDTEPKRVVSCVGAGALTTAGALLFIAAATKKLADIFKVEDGKKCE